ncbi:probable methyltransferase-like protein 15 homolog [Pollicipes pollicipes]|uniref:probable methyltransferase-like protein 15 homolog n=1 Tax=Pollicipes pollicipes TaxID=41117 RepID=UPI001884D7BC|nr:probable methyltransferase-like protein 15 homolog [Pollicipes pollicipes]
MWCRRSVWRAVRRSALGRRCSSVAASPPAPPLHVPVLADEVRALLALRPGQSVLDMTFGAGGHTRLLLETTPGLTVYALDRDPAAHERARQLAASWRGSGRVVPLLGRFSELPQLMQQAGVSPGRLDAALADCGCCSTQLEDAARGFSLARDGPLDMRMDGDRRPEQPTAAQLLAHAPEEALARIIRAYGEEPMARRVARAIVEARYLLRPLRTTGELAQLVRAVCARERRDKLGRPAHVATRTFQALRIFVNDELNELAFGVVAARRLLRVGGRLAVVTFHSLEDRAVKAQLQASELSEAEPRRHVVGRHGAALPADAATDVRHAARKWWRPVTKHVVVASEEEVAANPRSRSAKLRVAEKCDEEDEF